MKNWNWCAGFITTLALCLFYTFYFYTLKEMKPEKYNSSEILPAKIVAIVWLIGGTLFNAWKHRKKLT